MLVFDAKIVFFLYLRIEGVKMVRLKSHIQNRRQRKKVKRILRILSILLPVIIISIVAFLLYTVM